MNDKSRLLVPLMLAALLFLGAGCASSPLKSSWDGPFCFAVLADPQFGMTAEDKNFEKETELFQRAVDMVNRLKPAFVVICGDLVNKPGDEAQANELQRIAGSLDPSIQLHWVSGNHDVMNVPTPESLAWYRSRFGKDWYTFLHGGCRFFILNSTIIHRPDNVADEMARQRNWLEAELRRSRDDPAITTIVFLHHPLFLTDPEEDDQYFNIPGERRRHYLKLLEENGVSAVFAGHYHRNSYGTCGSMEMVTSGPVGKPLGDDPSGFTVVTVHEDHIEHTYRALEAAPLTNAQ